MAKGTENVSQKMQKPIRAIWNFLLDHFHQACTFMFTFIGKDNLIVIKVLLLNLNVQAWIY